MYRWLTARHGKMFVTLLGLLTVLFGLHGVVPSAEVHAATTKLRWATFNHPHGIWAWGQDWFLKGIEERTGGQVEIERFWSESLVGANDIPDALAGGVADIGAVLPGYYPGKLPLATIGTLPALAHHHWPAIMAYQELFRHPALEAEADRQGLRLVVANAGGPYYLFSRKPVSSLDDLKGMKIRSLGYQAQLLRELGATPVSMPATDLYDALGRGIIDGVLTDADVVVAYNLYEHGKYFIRVPFGVQLFTIAFSKMTWNRLPQDVRDTIESLLEDNATEYARIYELEGLARQEQLMQEHGVQILSFPAEESAKLAEMARRTVWNSWIQDQESRGRPGREVFEAFEQLINKYVELDPTSYD